MTPCGYDAELRRHNEVLRQACDVQFNDHVLDIGCGSGQTTREAARAAKAGSALGVDVSAPAIERARELAYAEGIRNATFVCANAEAYRFPQERFEVTISRFGTMFFDDPAAAFANISKALRPAGRLVMMVWQAGERNEWDVTIRQSLGVVPSGLPDPFSLADPPTVTELLEGTGFADVTFTNVNEPVYYGPDVDAAMDWVRGFACTSEAVKQLDPAAAERALGRLREALAAHLREDGVWFNSRAWIVAARMPATARARLPGGNTHGRPLLARDHERGMRASPLRGPRPDVAGSGLASRLMPPGWSAANGCGLHGGGAFGGEVPPHHARAAECGPDLHVAVVEPVIVTVRLRGAPFLQCDSGNHPQVIQGRPGPGRGYQDLDRLGAQLRGQLPGPLRDRQRAGLGNVPGAERSRKVGVVPQLAHLPDFGLGILPGHVGHRGQPGG